MVDHADIKRDLPDWPDDVIDQWLFHLANREDTGWPPPDPLGTHAWTYILGHRPVSWWREVTWKLETTDCSHEKLSLATQRIVNQMIAEVGRKIVEDATRRRFNNAFQDILNTGGFPSPLIAMRMADGLSVIDGNHRVSAFCGVQLMRDERFQDLGKQRPAREHEIWIGTHSRGEVPLD